MIVLFTSNIQGGILQLIISILNILVKNNQDVRCFIPDNALISSNKNLNEYIIRYKKSKSIFVNNKNNKITIKEILMMNPKFIWYFDNCITCAQISILLKKGIKQSVIMHDAGGRHPSHNMSLIHKIHSLVERYYSKKIERNSNFITLLSAESNKKYLSRNSDKKTIVMKLGAHVPLVDEVKHKGLNIDNYILFFGRIDKYKGIINFLKPFNKLNNYYFVIAGCGKLTEEEMSIINSNDNVILLNRFISDGEMIYLFKYSRCLVLPYIEATQSGIIPIAYYYGKPVIVSNVDGLTQFVDDNQTGFICKNEVDYVNAVNTIYSVEYLKMQQMAKKYYETNLDFEKNIGLFFETINKE